MSSSDAHRSVLLFVEDPGAANWVDPVAKALESSGQSVRLFAEGTALAYLSQRGTEAEHIPPGADVAALVADCAPRAIGVGTSENRETRAFDLVEAARAQGIYSFALVDQPMNAGERFRGNSDNALQFVPETVFVADEFAARRYHELGLPPERVVAFGNPHYDSVRRRGAELRDRGRVHVRQELFPWLAPEQTLVVFLSELGYLLHQDAGWEREFLLQGRGGTTYRTLVVFEELLDALAESNPQARVIVRLHPKSSADDFKDYDVEIAGYSKAEDPLGVCMSADLVVGMTTSLLEEATLIGCRTMSILPRPVEATWLEAIATGRIPHVTTRADLRVMLQRLLSSADRDLPSPAIVPSAAGTIARWICSHITAE